MSFRLRVYWESWGLAGSKTWKLAENWGNNLFGVCDWRMDLYGGINMTCLWSTRTTIEVPDELLARAKVHVAVEGITLRQFFIEAVRHGLDSEPKKVRREPPSVGNAQGTPIHALSREQIDEAMFG